jgi:hypothetical protein
VTIYFLDMLCTKKLLIVIIVVNFKPVVTCNLDWIVRLVQGLMKGKGSLRRT